MMTLKDYFATNLEYLTSRPMNGQTKHFFKMLHAESFRKDYENGYFTEENLVDYADHYYGNFGGRFSFKKNDVVEVIVYTD